MKIHVSHITRYTYDRPVILDPQLLRLRPRCDGSQTVEAFQMHVLPKPAGMSQWSDYEGNAVASVWFEGATSSFTVASSFVAVTARDNPFDFILEPRATALPVRFTSDEASALHVYRQPAGAGPEIDALVSEVRLESGDLTSHFALRLAARVHELCSPVPRSLGMAFPPGETLSRRSGACRDLAVLYIEACRVAGLPARFVSGYHLGDTKPERHELHAWAEVFLPGAGWRGFDPSTGLAAGSGHVVVAAGARAEDAAPIAGSFRGAVANGNRVESTMCIDLDVEKVPEHEESHPLASSFKLQAQSLKL